MIFYRSNNTTPGCALSPSRPYGVGTQRVGGPQLDIGLAGRRQELCRLRVWRERYVRPARQPPPASDDDRWTGVPASNGYVLSSTTAG